MSRSRHAFGVLLAVGLATGISAQESIKVESADESPGRWVPVERQVDASLRGVCVVDDQTVWVSGAQGSLLVSSDGGKTWKKLSIPDSDAMDFRDVEARDDQTACVMVAGTPARIYYTEDGGDNWTIACEDQREGAFFDAMEFWDAQHGIAFGDAIDGRLVIATTNNGGKDWAIHDAQSSPEVYPNEHGYAASGSCLAVAGEQVAMIGLGGELPENVSHVRVLITRDRGRSWEAVETKLKGGATAGIFSVLIHGNQKVVAVGGDYLKEETSDQSATYSEDGGRTWSIAGSRPPSGYRSAVRPISRIERPVLIATGPNGSDFSRDFGREWFPIEGDGYHAIDFSTDGRLGWAVGSQGRMARWEDHSRE